MATRSERLDVLIAACDTISSHAQLMPASQSSRGFTYFVKTDAIDGPPSYVLKLAKIDEDDPDASEIYRTALPSEATALRHLAVEATGLRRLGETAVPMPAVSSYVTESGNELPPYILMEYSGGTVLSKTDDLLSTAQQEEMIEQLGRYLALAHETFSFKAIGET